MELLKKNLRQMPLWILIVVSLTSLNIFAGDDGLPSQINEDSAQIILGICASQTGLVMSAGRAHQASGPVKQYLGSVRQFTTSASVGVTGDTSLQARGAITSNYNSTEAVTENGTAYYDAFGTTGENLIYSCAYDSSRSVWWAAGRAVKSTISGNRYVVVIWKIPKTGGLPTLYDTGIGGDATNGSNNMHGILGGPKSLVFDSSTDMLFVTGYRGTTNAYQPFIAQIRIASNLASNTTVTALTSLNNSSASGWRGVGLTQISSGGHIYGVATPVSTTASGFDVFDYTPATWSGGWSGGSYSTTASGISLSGYTAFVKPTSIVNNGSNKLYVSGAAKAASNGTNFGFVAALTTGLALDTSNFSSPSGFMTSQISSRNTGFNDLVYISNSSCDSGTARIFVSGFAYTGTNNKSLLGKLTSAGALASWGTNNSGFYQPSEFSHDEISTTLTYDSTTGTIIVGGRVNVFNASYTAKSAGYVRTYTSCSSTSLAPYTISCGGKLNNEISGSYFTVNKGTTFTGSLSSTLSNSSVVSLNASQAACQSHDPSIVSNPSNGTFSALEIGGPVVVDCTLGSGANKISCGSWNVTVQSMSYGPGGNNTQMLAMFP